MTLKETECLEGLKTMETRKTPGSDGLPAEFYKVLWNDKCKTLLGELKFWYGTGHFSITQRRGINKTNPQGRKTQTPTT